MSACQGNQAKLRAGPFLCYCATFFAMADFEALALITAWSPWLALHPRPRHHNAPEVLSRDFATLGLDPGRRIGRERGRFEHDRDTNEAFAARASPTSTGAPRVDSAMVEASSFSMK